MVTCFLFIQEPTAYSYNSLCLNQRGEIVTALALRSIAEIKDLHKHAKITIVLPTALFSIHYLTLPLLADKKAREAIPFALEDKLAQNIDGLHFAFERSYYKDGQYLVIVGPKDYLSALIQILDEHNLNFAAITLDWFALQPNEVAILGSYLLSNDNVFLGVVYPDIAELYLSMPRNTSALYSFTDSNSWLINKLAGMSPNVINGANDSYTWLAQRLHDMPAMNLCQAGVGSRLQSSTKRWYYALLGLSGLCLFGFFSIYCLKLYNLIQENARLDQQIAVIYHEFFPQAAQVISPKFRITQWIQAHQYNINANFWHILNGLAQTFKPKSMAIEKMEFAQQKIVLNVTTSSFQELEQLQNYLHQAKIKVKQLQATTNNKSNQEVLAILELSI